TFLASPKLWTGSAEPGCTRADRELHGSATETADTTRTCPRGYPDRLQRRESLPGTSRPKNSAWMGRGRDRIASIGIAVLWPDRTQIGNTLSNNGRQSPLISSQR